MAPPLGSEEGLARTLTEGQSGGVAVCKSSGNLALYPQQAQSAAQASLKLAILLSQPPKAGIIGCM